MHQTPEIRNWISAVAAREELRFIAQTLNRVGIVPALLKGAYLHAKVYVDPAERGLGDLDLLVPQDRFGAALCALTEAGFEIAEAGNECREVTLKHPQWPLLLDLHRWLFPSGQFRFNERMLLERSTNDTCYVGAPVLMPEPYDAFAHVLGHMALALLDTGQLHRPGDLAAMMRALSLEPRGVAVHLRRVGLAYAGSYTLRQVLVAMPDPRLADVLHELGGSRVSRRFIDRLVLRTATTLGQRRQSALARLPVTLLHRSPRQAVPVLLQGVALRLRNLGLRNLGLRNSGR